MLELSKKILVKVSFDPTLFYKELMKAVKWIPTSEEIQKLKEWCYAEFGTTQQPALQKVFISNR